MARSLPAVFWFYGLSGAGKTTLSRVVAAELSARGTGCLVLDGDDFRREISADLGFSVADREENIRRAAERAKLACQEGMMVLAAFVTPTSAMRARARSIVAPLPFYEVYVDCPFSLCAQRDVKGLYAKAAAGRLKDFTGRDAVFEAPEAPDLRIDTQVADEATCAQQVLAFVENPSGSGKELQAFANPLTEKIVRFLRGIGLTVLHGRSGDSFLPGIRLDGGRIIIDEAHLLYPGDLLHEAGHLAVTVEEERASMGHKLEVTMGDEIGAIIWSYAAALHIGIDPAVVFHPDGYRGSSDAFLENFKAGRFVGVPLLQWMGLTLEPRQAAERGIAPFPHMIQWLRS